MWIWIFAVGIVLFCYAFFIEPRWFTLRRAQLQVKKKIPRPFTILHLSDTHFAGKNTYKEKFFSTLASSVNPDFIFITGDIIDCNEGIEPAARVLGNLKARFGTFAIFGNHDYYDYHVLDNLNFHLKGVKTPDRVNDVKLFKEKLEASG